MTGEPVTEVREEFRIECRKPRARIWRFVPFTGAQARTLDEAKRNLTWAKHDTPNWQYRIMRHTVTTVRTETEWEEVPIEERYEAGVNREEGWAVRSGGCESAGPIGMR